MKKKFIYIMTTVLLLTFGLSWSKAETVREVFLPSVYAKPAITMGIPPLLWRQGGSDIKWTVPGTTTYSVASPKIQVGSATMFVHGGVLRDKLIIKFPQSFKQPPIVFLTVRTLPRVHGVTLETLIVAQEHRSAVTILATYVDETPETGLIGTLDFTWLAIGE